MLINTKELTYMEFINQPHIKHLDEARKKYQYFVYGQLFAMQRNIFLSRKSARGGGSVEEEETVPYITFLYLGKN
jgi:hypothetical protein